MPEETRRVNELLWTAKKTVRGRWLVRVLAAPTYEFDYRWVLCVLWSLDIYYHSYGYEVAGQTTVARMFASGLVVVAVCTYFVHIELKDCYLTRSLQCQLGYLAAVPFTVVVTYGLWTPYGRCVCALARKLVESWACAVGDKRLLLLDTAACDAVLVSSALYLYASLMKATGHWKVMQKRLPCHRVRFKEPLVEPPCKKEQLVGSPCTTQPFVGSPCR